MVKRRAFVSLPPIITLLLMMVLPVLLPNRTGSDEWDRSASESAQAALDSIPLALGGWHGEVIALPRPAAPLLGSPAILARRYVHASGARLDVVAVQCADVRDLLGHYPPACYPSVGWRELSRRETTLRIAGQPVPFRVYSFGRLLGTPEEERICVLSSLALPDGSWTTELADLRRVCTACDSPVGQIQVVSSNSMDEDSVVPAAERLLSQMSRMSDAMGVSRGPTDG